MKLLSSGIKLLDEALGGGLLEDSNLLIIYDTYSKGWALAFEILRNRIKEGDFGVIVNSVLTYTPLKMELNSINFDIEREGQEGNLALIDIFSSFYGIAYFKGFVYTNPTMDAETFIPKYAGLYRRVLEEMIGERRPIGIDVTVDGLAFLLGEDRFLKTFQRLMAMKEKARITERRKRPLNIFLLNRGRASEKLISWMVLYSQYVIEFQPISPGVEKLVVRNSPLPTFNPLRSRYEFRFAEGRIELKPLAET